MYDRHGGRIGENWHTTVGWAGASTLPTV